MKQTIDDFLKATGIEAKAIEYAAQQDTCNAAHWLRWYKDTLKMFYRDTPKKEYSTELMRYVNFKREVEDLLGERLQL